jgi:hypothetical protein
MVTDHNALHPHCNAFSRVVDGQDAFQDDWARPALAQGGEILPAVAIVREDGLRPFDGCGLHVFFDVDTVRFFELTPEDGVGEADCDADFVGAQEGAVSVRFFISDLHIGSLRARPGRLLTHCPYHSAANPA